jgi:hypothetical protein
MQSKAILFISALVGLVVGLVSTYPFLLGPIPSLILWGVAGIVLGLFTEGKKTIIWSGVLYGVFLSVFFLFSRFGGTADRIASYALFVAGMSVVGVLGGIVVVLIGSKLRRKKESTI